VTTLLFKSLKKIKMYDETIYHFLLIVINTTRINLNINIIVLNVLKKMLCLFILFCDWPRVCYLNRIGHDKKQSAQSNIADPEKGYVFPGIQEPHVHGSDHDVQRGHGKPNVQGCQNDKAEKEGPVLGDALAVRRPLGVNKGHGHVLEDGDQEDTGRFHGVRVVFQVHVGCVGREEPGLLRRVQVAE